MCNIVLKTTGPDFSCLMPKLVFLSSLYQRIVNLLSSRKPTSFNIILGGSKPGIWLTHHPPFALRTQQGKDQGAEKTIPQQGADAAAISKRIKEKKHVYRVIVTSWFLLRPLWFQKFANSSSCKKLHIIHFFCLFCYSFLVYSPSQYPSVFCFSDSI